MRRACHLAPIALLVLVFAAIAYHLRWNSDDAFVSFRAVAHLLAGHGPNYNVGERIEAFTNPLWVYALAGVAWAMGLEHLERIAVYGGIALSCGGLALVMLGALRLHEPHGENAAESAARAPTVALPVFAAALAGIRPFQEYATSGLETGLAFFVISAGLAQLFGAAEERPRRTALWLSLLPLVRPDFALYLLALGGWLLLRCVRADAPSSERLRRCVGVAAALVALPATYQIFRMGYYALLVPNTALVKEASMARWDQGFFYLVNFVEPYHLLLLIAAFGLLASLLLVRRRGRHPRFASALGACTLASALHAAYVTRVGGDFMHARLLLTDLWVLTAPLAALPALRSRGRPRLAWIASALAIAWGVTASLHFRVPYEDMGPRFVNNERAVWRSGADTDFINDEPVDPTRPPEPTVAGFFLSGNAGIRAYAFAKHGIRDVVVIDYCGLGGPILSHILLTGERREIGHEKCYLADTVPWLLAARPTLPSDPDLDPQRVEFAREVLHASIASEYLSAIRAPLTARRFLANLRNASRYTRFRLPPLDWFYEVPDGTPDPGRIYDQMMLQALPYDALPR